MVIWGWLSLWCCQQGCKTALQMQRRGREGRKDAKTRGFTRLAAKPVYNLFWPISSIWAMGNWKIFQKTVKTLFWDRLHDFLVCKIICSETTLFFSQFLC